jgi:hypothetical protein
MTPRIITGETRSEDPSPPEPPRPSPPARGGAPAVPEIGGPEGPEPTRYGDWEKGGRCSDF